MITFKLNGKEVQGKEGQNILQVAEKSGVEIPTLCHHKALEPAGMCRLCTVELFDGRKTRFVTACNYPVWEGMQVNTDTAAIIEIRTTIVELLYARCPDVPFLIDLAQKYDIEEPSFKTKGDDCILCGLCTRICERMGNSAISLTGRGVDIKVDTPFQIQTDICIACGACAFVCPTGHIKLEDITQHALKSIPSEYDMGLKGRKPIYVPYPQAIPNTPAIDRSKCVHYKTGGCKICTEFCEVHAIDHLQEDETIEFEVGAIILSPGCEVYDPGQHDVYGYKKSPNIVTSLEFERMLSSSGPLGGHLIRPSDGKELEKIAWLQCVGSRDVHIGARGYCSSVCCTYAIKEAMLAKEHCKSLTDAAIFYMDIRTHGKDFEKYYLRGKEQAGIRFVKTRITNITPAEGNGRQLIRYVDNSGQRVEEEFDMVVLSVGLGVGRDAIDLARNLEVELDHYDFAATDNFAPVQTSKAGIYVCGAFEAPKDIPSSVIESSAAAGAAGAGLNEARWTMTKTKEIPAQIDLSGEPPRIGVFVCRCGTNIGGIVNVPKVVEFGKHLPHVVSSEESLFTCSQDAQEKMREIIKEQRLNRVVVAACSPKTHEGIFMENLEACGLNRYLFEMCNIRNQDSWVHSETPEIATQKAIELVKMSVARAATLNILEEKKISVTQRALIIGGGVAGMNAALCLAEQGYEAVLVEKEEQLGGMALNIATTIQGADVQAYLNELIQSVISHSRIQTLTQSIVVGFSGFKGNFTTEVLVGPGMYERKIDHGVVIMATGAGEYKPQEFLYGQDKRVVTQIELSQQISKNGAAELNQVVMIQCVGSRNEANPNCSRVCCQSAIKNALSIKKLNPETEIYILYRDIRMYGLLEDFYREARKQGVAFFRFDPEDEPDVKLNAEGIVVSFNDPVLGRRFEVCADLLALSAGVVAEDSEEIASILKLDRSMEGFLNEAHVKLRPVDMSTEGIFVCGTAHGPKLISESISMAYAAASRATTFLSKTALTLSAVTAQVEQDKCAACLVCVRSCPYDVPVVNEEGVSEIDEALCHGCGVCAAECPAKAIKLNWYEDNQIMCKVDALLEGAL